ncbi:hypothetical protein SAMN05444279_10454 [Ruegeria intermedia]|uniref:Uncharacterized protein n=1 Tax=Ruegeria intermedia TaxID=996115 RepID=A0A1M4UG78_9RHOB|nr:hypothetical protein SAMN05444279_10454 [Ruegeria intermedia]
MTSKHSYHGGLQFQGDPDGALERFGEIAAATLEDYGHLVERKALLSATEASIVTSQYLVSLIVETDDPETPPQCRRDQMAGLKAIIRPAAARPRNRLTVTLSPVSGLLDDSEISELMLVVMLYRMVDICTTQRVEWLSPKTVLTTEQFMGAFDTFMPRKARSQRDAFRVISGPFAGLQTESTDAESVEPPAPKANSGRPIQLTDDQLLSIAFRAEADEPQEQVTEDEDRPSDALRLASWALTGAVATISAPIALSMTAVNLIRGEDFRLNTQVLAYTVAIVSLSSSGAIAGAANALGM